MDKTLTIDLQREGEQYVLHLTGRLDTLGSRTLDETISQLPNQAPLLLVLDMEHLTFLSSAGIRILIKYYKHCRETQGDFILLHVPAQATGVLKMVGLEQLTLTGNQPSDPIIQEYEHQNFKFHWQQLHKETARLLCLDQQSNEPFSLHSYDFLLGRNQNQREFIALNNTIIIEENATPFAPLYALGMYGLPTHHLRFETIENQPATLSGLLTCLLQICEAECAGIILLTQSLGITGVTFENGQAQFTKQPVYSGHRLLIGGVAHLKPEPEFKNYTRSISSSLSGHFHAAVYSGQSPLEEKENDLSKVLQNYIGNTQPLRIFHLLDDNRFLTGNEENRICKGNAWIIKNK